MVKSNDKKHDLAEKTDLVFVYCAGILGSPNSSTRTPFLSVAKLSAPGSGRGASGALLASSKYEVSVS